MNVLLKRTLNYSLKIRNHLINSCTSSANKSLVINLFDGYPGSFNLTHPKAGFISYSKMFFNKSQAQSKPLPESKHVETKQQQAQITEEKQSVQTPTSEIPTYIPIEEKTQEQKDNDIEKFEKEKGIFYGSNNQMYRNKLAESFEVLAKRRRLGYLNANYHANVHRITALRYRTLKDDISKLPIKNEIAVQILGREEFKEINIIVKKSQIHQFNK